MTLPGPGSLWIRRLAGENLHARIITDQHAGLRRR
jgi:hypothetical protein